MHAWIGTRRVRSGHERTGQIAATVNVACLGVWPAGTIGRTTLTMPVVEKKTEEWGREEYAVVADCEKHRQWLRPAMSHWRHTTQHRRRTHVRAIGHVGTKPTHQFIAEQKIIPVKQNFRGRVVAVEPGAVVHDFTDLEDAGRAVDIHRAIRTGVSSTTNTLRICGAISYQGHNVVKIVGEGLLTVNIMLQDTLAVSVTPIVIDTSFGCQWSREL